MRFSVIHHAHAAGPLLDGVPDFQQTTFAVLAPLAVPKAQRRDALFLQKFLPLGVTLHSFGMTVLRTVQFHGQLCIRAVEIQNVSPGRVLATEFETGKTPAAQRPSKRLFVVRLIAPQLAGDLFQAHGGMMFVVGKISSPSRICSLSSSNEKAGMRSH